MEQDELYVLMGAMVETSLAQRFKEALGKVKTDDAIKVFIEMVADGKIKMEE